MDKDIIKKHLIVLKEESEAPGLTKTKKIRDESGKTNKAANQAVAKEMENLVKPLNSKDVSEPVKNEYTSEEEEYHNEMEIRNGNETIEYSNKPNEAFQKRAEEAISGSKRMGNANVDKNGTPLGNVVTADQAGFTGPKFGENLVKTIKASKKKRDDAETVRGPKTSVSGADIKDSSMSNKGSKSIALSENKSIKENKTTMINIVNNAELDGDAGPINDKLRDGDVEGAIKYAREVAEEREGLGHPGNKISAKDLRGVADELEKMLLGKDDVEENKPIKENKINKKNKMKRLVFKKEFKGIENALKVIPESYKVNGKEFHMTDGNEKYEIKWEGTLTEGRAVILKASDKNLMTEDMAKMKHLMGYSSKETLGTVKGSARLDENARFNDILGKTKNLLNEGPVNGGMQGFTGEGNLGGMDEEYSDNEQNMATLKSSQIAVGKIKERGNMNLDKHPIEVKSGEETLIARFILSVEVPNKESAEANVIFNMGDGDNWEINVPDAKRVTDTLLEFGMKITQSGFQTIIGIVKSVIDASQSLDDTQKLEYLNSVVRHFRSYVK